MTGASDRTTLSVMALGVVGLAISAYLTLVHYAGAALVCQQSALVDCDAVTTSTYSLIPATSVPVSVAGLVWSAVVIALGAALARGGPRRPLEILLLVWATGALVAALSLIYAEIVIIGRICLWCTAFHVVVLGVVLIAIVRLQRGAEEG